MPGQLGSSSQRERSAHSFAGHSISISVKSSTIAWITLPKRCNACSASCRTIGVIGASAHQRVDAALLNRRIRLRGSVAMIATALAIIVAALCIETSPMGRDLCDTQGKRGRQCDHSDPKPGARQPHGLNIYQGDCSIDCWCAAAITGALGLLALRMPGSFLR